MRIPTPICAALLVLAATAACSRGTGDRPKAEYDENTGRLRTLAYDANSNGKNDAVSYMDGTRIHRIELDLDENGKVERWDFYGGDRRLEKVGLSQRNDGVMDAEAFYTEEGVLQRIQVSTKRDGRYDRTEFYVANVLVRSEEDTNGDGRADKWDTYRTEPNPMPGAPAYSITATAFDDTGAGTPTRRFVYGDRGVVVRVEVDRDGDGVFDGPASASFPEAVTQSAPVVKVNARK
jgi:hypothetical protein